MKIHFNRGFCETSKQVAQASTYGIGCNIGYITQIYTISMASPDAVEKICRALWDEELMKYKESDEWGRESGIGYIRHFVGSVCDRTLKTPGFEAFLKVFPLEAKFEIKEAHSSRTMWFLILGTPSWHNPIT